MIMMLLGGRVVWHPRCDGCRGKYVRAQDRKQCLPREHLKTHGKFINYAKFYSSERHVLLTCEDLFTMQKVLFYPCKSLQ